MVHKYREAEKGMPRLRSVEASLNFVARSLIIYFIKKG